MEVTALVWEEEDSAFDWVVDSVFDWVALDSVFDWVSLDSVVELLVE